MTIKAALIRALSLANLVVMPFWLSKASLGTPFDNNFLLNHYHQHVSNSLARFGYLSYEAAILLTLILAVIFYPLVTHSGRQVWARRVVGFVFLLSLVSASNQLRVHFLNGFSVSELTRAGSQAQVIAILLTGFILWLLYLFRGRWVVLQNTALNVLAPTLLIFFINTGLAINILKNPKDHLFSKNFLPPGFIEMSTKPTNPIFLFIFDKWDYERTFLNRQVNIELPNIDRLVREDVLMRSPSFGHSTMNAIPTMVLGQKVKYIRALPTIDLEIQAEGSNQNFSFRQSSTLFHDIKELGGQSAVIGTGYHPICDLFGEVIAHCTGMGLRPKRQNESVISRLDDVAKLVVSQFPGVRYLSKFYINDNVDNPVVAEYKKYIDALYSVISDGHYQFVYTHLLLPHPPFFYDASTNDFMDPVTDEKYYDDALELVDRTIGDVRSKLDAQGVWENALIIFTADHGAGGNIPLLIQFPGNRKPLQNENPVFAPRLREMLKLYQTGKIRNAAEMISFFETGKHLTSRD